MGIIIDVEIQSKCTAPSQAELEKFVQKALAAAPYDQKITTLELSLRVVDKSEMQSLNRHYRDKDKPTNVLSFASQLPREMLMEMDSVHLGDIILCAEVIEEEAMQQNKALDAHWAHMVIHGCLHLIGYDHVDQNDAKIMEELETLLLTDMGYPMPYGDFSA